jgi:hypothetical protein
MQALCQNGTRQCQIERKKRLKREKRVHGVHHAGQTVHTKGAMVGITNVSARKTKRDLYIK